MESEPESELEFESKSKFEYRVRLKIEIRVVVEARVKVRFEVSFKVGPKCEPDLLAKSVSVLKLESELKQDTRSEMKSE